MWSVGCTLAELVFGNPVFGGTNIGEILASIVHFMGAPPKGWGDAFPSASLLKTTLSATNALPVCRQVCTK